MKKTFALLLCVFTLLYMAACSAPKESTPTPKNTQAQPDAVPITLYNGTADASVRDGEDLMVEASYPVFALSEADALAHPALDATLKKRAEEMKTALTKEAQSYITDVEEYRKYDYVLPTAYFYTDHAIRVRRADSAVVSLLSFHTAYTGGAHGNYGFSGETYDTQTGKLLTLDDVITDTSRLPALIEEKLKADYADVEFFREPDIEQHHKEYTPSWTLDANGITFYYGPYAFASYADGAQAVTLTYAEFPDLFYDKYKTAAKNYGIQLHKMCPFLHDIDGDGKAERLRYYITNVDAADTELYIFFGDEQYKEAISAQDAEATFIFKDGKPFIYVTLLLTDGTQKCVSYSLDNGIQKQGEVTTSEDTYTVDGNTLQRALTHP